jgi:hypothetical protein
MTWPRPLLAVSLLLALAVPGAARAAAFRVAVLPATGANVHEGHLAAATDVFRSQLERTGRFEVVLAPPPPGGAEPTPSDAAAAARGADASLGVTLRISRLGESALVRLAAYRPDGAAAHLDELGAGSPDDLEPVLRRLARGLADGRPARELAELDSVTERESDPYLKYAATQLFGVRLGTAFFAETAGGGSGASVSGGGIFWLYDARSYLADLSFDVLGSDGRRLVGVGLGFYYPFGKGNLAPYLGGGLGYHWTDTGGGGSGAGLALRGAAGLIVGRLATVQVRLEAGYHLSLFEEEPETDFLGQPQPGTTARAHGPTLSVGLGF